MGGTRTHARGRLLALLGFEGTAVAALHRAGRPRWAQVDWADLPRWLETVPTEDAIVAVLRLTALGCAYWLLASTLLYLAASATRLPGLVRGVQWATLPGVRGVVDKVVAASIVAPMVLGTAAPAMAASDAGVAVQVQVPSRPGDDAARPPTLRRVPDSRTQAQPQPPPQPASGDYTVVKGDNLWRISARKVGNGNVAPYWSKVVETNRGRLRSGNPNLIYPGERVELPPTEG